MWQDCLSHDYHAKSVSYGAEYHGHSSIGGACERTWGGAHIHKIFLIPVNEGATVVRLAELALANLYRNPKEMALLQQLDILFLDENGQVSAQLMSVMDIICRRIRGNDKFMGGIVIFSTMDGFQLKPVKGRPPLLSAHMLTSFDLYVVKHSVRAARDANLQRIQQITRVMPNEITVELVQEFRNLIKDNCTFFRVGIRTRSTTLL